ncbi:MAG: hypothetical protein U9R74_06650 [Pseudomonadota bacterium]|nr:hypothetical protein [Pseudomonadota bacterium]
MRDRLLAIRWALARVAFVVYVVFSVATLVGGFLSAPLMTWYFLGDWRFWRHWRTASGLFPHALRLTAMMLGHSRAFMFSVPLASPPSSVPDPSVAVPRSDWSHGDSCGSCTSCCEPGGHVCPLLDQEQGLCRGYNSFYWRYFNCGRYPSVTEEIHFYDCRKWALTISGQTGPAALDDLPTLSAGGAALARQASCACGNCAGNCTPETDLLTQSS